jgi:hypothetical protein
LNRVGSHDPSISQFQEFVELKDDCINIESADLASAVAYARQLAEEMSVQDYETRAWALSGLTRALDLLRQSPDLEGRASQVFALARPVLSKILASPDEPSMLRLMPTKRTKAVCIFVSFVSLCRYGVGLARGLNRQIRTARLV